MRLGRTPLCRLILLLSIALLVTRMAGNHVHLCFDGAEPPVSVHTLDLDEHHLSDSGHDDQDLKLPSATIVKHAGHTDDSLLFVVLFVGALFLPAAERSCVRRRRQALPLRQPPIFLPPLRGPPQAFRH